MHNQNTKCEQLRCCDNCRSSPFNEFKEVVKLKKSGLFVYIHENELKPQRDKTRSVILYNTGDRELKRYDYIIELCRYKTKCYKCIANIQRVRNLLDNITSIRKYQILAICDYCKRSTMRNKCKRCEYIINQFLKNKVQECKKYEEIFTMWFYKVQQILTSITQEKIFCKHNIWSDFDLKTQLDNLLQHLKTSLPLQQPYIEIYPDKICLQSSENKMIESKRILDELLFKLKTHTILGIDAEQKLTDSGSDLESVCVCKFLKEDESKSTLTPMIKKLSEAEFSQGIQTISSEKYNVNCSKDNARSTLPIIAKENNIKKNEEVNKTQRDDITRDKKDKTKLKKYKNKEQENKGAKLIKMDNAAVCQVDDTEKPFQLILKLIKERDIEKKDKESLKIQENIKFPVIPDIPSIKWETKTTVDTKDEASTMQCSEASDHKVSEMIKGNKIVPYYESQQKSNKMKTPLLFNILANCTRSSESEQKISDSKIHSEKNCLGNEGLIFYKLSDRKFIENGWTKLPTTKIMRRINIYKMTPPYAEFDWFKYHLKQKNIFYATGGKSAEVYADGLGKWFYENGDVALVYSNATGFTSGKRYIIYSSSEGTMVNNKKKTTTILGCFDSFGNGIVYDHGGHVRLKYNQCEGLVIDKKIGPPGRWKWHNLNEPAEIEHIFVDTEVEEDPSLQEYVKKTAITKEANKEMMVLELQNIMKERATKILQAMQKFKPFEIRIKAFKINDYFSLKIIDQSKIYIVYRCGGNYFKQNIGMMVKCDEIIDAELVEFGDVSTPYDPKTPKSESMSYIKNIVLKARHTK